MTTADDELKEAVDTIDAALFTGDAYQDEASRDHMILTVARWSRELQRKVAMDEENDKNA